MRARVAITAGLVAGLGALGAVTVPASSVGISGAGVSTFGSYSVPCLYLVESCGDEPIAYTDQGATNNVLLVQKDSGKVNLTDPGVLIIGVGTCATRTGVGSAKCKLDIGGDLSLYTGEGNDVITLKGSTTFADVYCGAGLDKVYLRFGAHAKSLSDCEKVFVIG
jgi:hypothetical protein